MVELDTPRIPNFLNLLNPSNNLGSTNSSSIHIKVCRLLGGNVLGNKYMFGLLKKQPLDACEEAS